MIHNKFRYLLTLVALFAISTGAWATEPKVINSTVAVSDLNEGDILIEGAQITLTSDHSYYLNFLQNRFFLYDATTPSISGFMHNTTTVTVGANGLVTGLSYDATARPATESGEEGNAWEVTAVEGKTVSIVGITYDASAEAGPTVAWDASTKTGTFTMPGSDVVLTPQYAPAAQLDENGAPAAVSGLEIAADAAIITEGHSAQGTLLYAVGTSATEKPALTAFAATLPNAKDQTAAGNYYVWYYIQGQDTPQGQEPTAENTFNDSEIMGPVMVELLTNEHTLNIKQSPNITVTVAGTAVTPTDDKVTPVTTGQEVKIKAKDGYKLRKVEVKKGGGEPVLLTTIRSSDNTNFRSGSKTFDNIATVTFSGEVANDGDWGWYHLTGITLTVTPVEGITITRVKFTCKDGSAFDETAPFEAVLGDPWYNPYMLVNGESYGEFGVTKIEVYGYQNK